MTVLRQIFQFVQKNLLLSILFLAFFVRFAAIFVIGSGELEHEYKTIVLNLAAGQGFVYYSIDQNDQLTTEFVTDPKLAIPSAFKSPVYPFFLLGFVKLFGAGPLGMWVIETVQAILGCLTCWVVYKITREKFGEPQALLAATGMAFYPLLIYSSTQISDTVIFLIFEVLAFWFYVRLEKKYSRLDLLFFSTTFGLFMLARPEGFLYFPFVLLWLVFRFPKQWVRPVGVLMAICALVLVPWGLRNYFQMGKFVLNTAGGLNLWEGQNQNAVGVPSWYLDPPGVLPEAMVNEIFYTGYDRQFEIKQDNVFFRNALADMLADPGRVVALGFRKAVFFWTSLFFGFKFNYAGVKSPIYWLPWLLMLPFFIYGLVSTFKEYKKHGAFYLVFVVSTLTCMIFLVLPRYTVLVYPWTIVFAAQGIWELYLRVTNWARKTPKGSSASGA